ncbi:redox-sensing transcriptional repressor Rex [Sporomusa sphaeroides DSM 2875]|uniref:redox-sensing transcriptional repressor Rex n=1 Tax=Sporomusa sphaeroides TaxID=47679 RepID=UPI00202F7D1B|nr:redox-sensing transcriptional repressor Rex [Sporomusa sphaeroides]MCM0760909.1 redox-sensing transcriptional repressor Rex [Sporomusa sphaeroides DSM 2875]
MKENKANIAISKATIDRLPIYYRVLKQIQDDGIALTSSDEMGRKIGVSPEQIRKDLSAFGEFGKKGVGYFVQELKRNIGEILGLNKKWNIAIVGLGHLGWSLANYTRFASQGFHVQAMFDIDPEKIGQKINEVEVFHIDSINEMVRSLDIQIGIITVPAGYAQDVATMLIEAGITGIWNFAPVRLDVPANVHVVSEDFSIGLNSMSYYLLHSGIHDTDTLVQCESFFSE